MKQEPIESNSHAHAAHEIRIDWYPDDFADAPWEREDGHGPVSEWTRRDKHPGERVLCEDGHSRRYYDHQQAVATARRDGWGLSNEDVANLAARLGRAPTQGDIVAESVERDFRYLRSWCNDGWQYVGYVVTITDPDGAEMDFPDRSLWGIDSPSMGYFETEALEIARSYIDAETSARIDAACRDIVTV